MEYRSGGQVSCWQLVGFDIAHGRWSEKVKYSTVQALKILPTIRTPTQAFKSRSEPIVPKYSSLLHAQQDYTFPGSHLYNTRNDHNTPKIFQTLLGRHDARNRLRDILVYLQDAQSRLQAGGDRWAKGLRRRLVRRFARVGLGGGSCLLLRSWVWLIDGYLVDLYLMHFPHAYVQAEDYAEDYETIWTPEGKTTNSQKITYHLARNGSPGGQRQSTLNWDFQLFNLKDRKTVGGGGGPSSREPDRASSVLLSWAVQRGTSVAPKSVKTERMVQNLAVVELQEEDFRRIEGLKGEEDSIRMNNPKSRLV
ncbi:hypothetical protein L873DRAFT_1786928 [Choiromyces venosus 120613-1]|uniref:Uncharacterized protein n=1 Tax=Choiromyces venosus 120613-1 TaxID=1336337 RepID=A0A3N4JZ07_9PEZI|nr:hypothetical protein L873DRAFT_1786928 [Choiromyces venosus 120613-1]